MSDPDLDAELAAHRHDHRHRDVSGGWLRAATFGAMDGLVTTSRPRPPSPARCTPIPTWRCGCT